jgi:hypothetical protein
MSWSIAINNKFDENRDLLAVKMYWYQNTFESTLLFYFVSRWLLLLYTGSDKDM